MTARQRNNERALYTALVVVGFAALLTGVWIVFWPAALIAGGAAVAWLGLIGLGMRR